MKLRRWLRFSLSTVFAVTTSVAVGLVLAPLAYDAPGALSVLCPTVFGGPSALLGYLLCVAMGRAETGFQVTFIAGTPIVYGVYAYVLSMARSQSVLLIVIAFHATCMVLCMVVLWLFLIA